MTALQQGSDQSPQGLTSTARPVAPAQAAQRAAAHVAEVSALRLRVAQLEAELAALKASQPQSPTTALTPPCRPTIAETPPAAEHSNQSKTQSEFEQSNEPAVVPVSNPGFAEAWARETKAEEETSFEAKVAERAFFEASAVDERSRNWLLGA